MRREGFRKGAIELSVNFIIVSIISILLIGMGVFLIMKGQAAWEKEWEKVKAFHESKIREAIARSGQLVMIYPNTITVNRGEDLIFTLGITNELGRDDSFSVIAKEPIASSEISILYASSDVVEIKNTETKFVPIKIITDKALNKQYIINICAYNTTAFPVGNYCPGTDDEGKRYGDLQKIILNIK
jgi:hypothetical protein